MKAMIHSVLFVPFISLSLISQVSAQSWIQQGLDINGEAAGDFFGQTVSVSADGTRVAVGAPSNDGGGNGAGHARIFENTGAGWTQLGSDINGEAPGDLSGSSVSISADGTRVAVGAPSIGSVYVRVFDYSDGSWEQVGEDIEGKSTAGGFGTSVSLSADGSCVAVGDPRAGFSKIGNTRIFKYSGGNWTQQGEDIYGHGLEDRSGSSVSINADGTRVAIGAPYNDLNGENSGLTRIYDYTDGSWTNLGSDINGDGAGEYSGRSVSICADGSRVAVGAPYSGDGGYRSGRTRIYEYSGGDWMQLGVDINGNYDEKTGYYVSLSADSFSVAIGNWGSPSGVVRIYKFLGGSWVQHGLDISRETGPDLFGIVSISSNGSSVAIGAPYNDTNGEKSGQVSVFQDWSKLTIKILGNGVVAPPSGFYQPGTNLSLMATTDSGWLFTGWSGDLIGDYTTSTTNVVLDRNRINITATFSDDADGDGILNTNETIIGTDPRNSDSDYDGLSDSQELYTYDTNPLVRDMDGDGLSDGQEILTYSSDPKVTDTDLDGFDDGYEVSTGYDPASANSTPELYSIIKTSIQFVFNAASGQVYRIEGTPVLSSPWETVEDSIPGSGGLITRHYDVDLQSNKFFRAKRD